MRREPPPKRRYARNDGQCAEGEEAPFNSMRSVYVIIPCRFHHLTRGIVPRENVNDSVAIDAKRILLRYGAPIAVLDDVSEVHRVEFAREITKTTLADREPRIRELLREHGYLEED
jgi:hypothetical protein